MNFKFSGHVLGAVNQVKIAIDDEEETPAGVAYTPEYARHFIASGAMADLLRKFAGLKIDPNARWDLDRDLRDLQAQAAKIIAEVEKR